MRIILSIIIVSLANPVFAASGPFISLSNTNFVVLLAFLLFVGLLIYLKVPGKLNGMLDERAKGIQSELDEARSLREEAQSILAEYERKQKEVQNQADQIVANAKEEAKIAANLGPTFGKNGHSFLRFNFATTTENVRIAAERLSAAFSDL